MRVSNGAACAAINCENNRGKNPELSFFNFPKNRERRLKWIINCRRRDLLYGENSTKYARLCSNHFEQDQFMNALRNRLTWFAVPTLFDVPKSPRLWLSKRKVPLLPQDLKMWFKTKDMSTIMDERDCKSDLTEQFYTLDSLGMPIVKENVDCWDGSQAQDFYQLATKTESCHGDNIAMLKCEPYCNEGEKVYSMFFKEEPVDYDCSVIVKQEHVDPEFVNVGDNGAETQNESAVENDEDPLKVPDLQQQIKPEPDDPEDSVEFFQAEAEDGDIALETEPCLLLEPRICNT